MSSSELDLGDGDGVSVIDGIATSDLNTATIIGSSVVGVLISPLIGFIDIVQALVQLVTAPLTGAGESITTLFDALIGAPGELVISGIDTSEAALATVLGEGAAGLLAAPVAVGLVLLSLYLVSQYLEEESTGNLIPGLALDVPIIGTEEEGEE